MDKHRVFKMSFASVYPLYVQKAEKKGRTKKDVDEVICWLTGYSPQALATQIKQRKDFETFFSEAPSLHPNRLIVASPCRSPLRVNRLQCTACTRRRSPLSQDMNVDQRSDAYRPLHLTGRACARLSRAVLSFDARVPQVSGKR